MDAMPVRRKHVAREHWQGMPRLRAAYALCALGASTIQYKLAASYARPRVETDTHDL